MKKIIELIKGLFGSPKVEAEKPVEVKPEEPAPAPAKKPRKPRASKKAV